MALTIAGCGGENVKLKMGEKLTDLVDNQPTISRRAKQDKVTQAAEDQKAAFLKTLDSCGEEDTTYHATALQTRIAASELKTADETAKDELVLSIEGRIISSENLKTSIVPAKVVDKNSKISKITNSKEMVSEPLTVIDLTALVGAGSAPVLIRSNCFSLRKNDILKTNGRDIYIIADKISIAGTIQTQPDPTNNQAGKNAGSIYISGIQINFEDTALLNAKGGDTTPLAEVSEEDRNAFFDLIAAKFTTTTSESYISGAPAKNDSDAEFLFEAWEDIVHRNIPNIVQLDAYIYESQLTYHLRRSMTKSEMGSWGSVYAGPNDRISNRHTMDPKHRRKMIDAWKNPYQFYFPYSGNSYSPIHYVIETKVIQESLSIPLDSIAPEYEKLKGGRSGRIEIISPSDFKEPKMIFESGEGQVINFENVFDSNALPLFPIRKKIQRTAKFQMSISPGIHMQPQKLGQDYTEPTPVVADTSYVDLSSVNLRILQKGVPSKTYTQPVLQKNMEDFRKIKDRWVLKSVSPNYEKALENIRQ